MAIVILLFSNSDFKFILTVFFSGLVVFYFVVLSMYKPEIPKAVLTEKILELLGVKNIDDINLTKHSYVDENQVMTKSWVIEYQNAFKENNPYPADYFEKKNDKN